MQYNCKTKLYHSRASKTEFLNLKTRDISELLSYNNQTMPPLLHVKSLPLFLSDLINMPVIFLTHTYISKSF